MNDKTRFHTNVVIFVAVAFGIARLVMPIESEVHKEDLFKDFAHLFVGALFGAGIAGLRILTILEVVAFFIYLWVGIALIILEVVAFFIHKA